MANDPECEVHHHLMADGHCTCTADIDLRLSMSEVLDVLSELIVRIVTGDGEQQENLEMTDEEWQEYMEQIPDDSIEITMYKQDWMTLVQIARMKMAERAGVEPACPKTAP